ncbi:unnamed protein product [Albugo candida]|uniref:NADH-cytochrome b5 reductase n=1 Tax=Albugo candida TaxID=65357 RepID=A0A024GFV1_9STRA|nr:unnamed protein product [Albugo candida]|eukprot:CCI45577.1 unnamed protein product [Albugo candida]
MAGWDSLDSSSPTLIICSIIALAISSLLVYKSEIFRHKHAHALQVTKGGEPITVHLPLVEKERLSHDTRRFRFALPSKNHVLGLPVGQHITLRYKQPDGKVVMRSYTPVTSDDTLGYVDLVVKVYFKDVHPKFPLGGKMSQYLESLNFGDTIEVSGPKGKLTYLGKGKLKIKRRATDANAEIRSAKKIGMIAGGTGITPMLQILRRALTDPKDQTEFFLLFANQTEQDILLVDEINAMEREHAKLHVWFTIDRDASPTWKYSVGFVSEDMIREHLPPPASDVQIFMCGPPPMLTYAVQPAWEHLGYEKSMLFAF